MEREFWLNLIFIWGSVVNSSLHFFSSYLYLWDPLDFLKYCPEEGLNDCEMWEAKWAHCLLHMWFHTFLLGSLVFLCYLWLIINHVLDGPTNIKESVFQYLRWSGCFDNICNNESVMQKVYSSFKVSYILQACNHYK